MCYRHVDSMAANATPNTTFRLPMSSRSAQVPSSRPAVMCPLCAIQFAHVQRHIPRLVPNTHRFRHVRPESWHGGPPPFRVTSKLQACALARCFLVPVRRQTRNICIAAPSYKAPQSQLMMHARWSDLIGDSGPPIIECWARMAMKCPPRGNHTRSPHTIAVSSLSELELLTAQPTRRGHSQQTLLFRVWPPPITRVALFI
ncbi:hypothetical protein EDB89DRAFT_779638 [Lactarius sanguifluus]|nr:hypothetical protein EDB89DRAFT_779638 [Lactarius sanguifluus]